MSVRSFLLLFDPYVSMGIVAQMGQLPASKQCQVIHAIDIIWNTNINACLFVYQRDSGFIVLMAFHVIL